MPVSKCFVPGCFTGYNSERKRFAALGKKVLSLFTCTHRHIRERTIDRDRTRLAQEPWSESNMTLMRLKRLSRTVMCKRERYRFEATKLQRSNVVKFLEDHLEHRFEKVRYLALELLCCTIPRLANKTDNLLRPLLPKVCQMLGNNESKALKLKALHFLRGFFRHSKNLMGFVEDFIEFGINNPDSDVQISCCIGLNIIFDFEIDDNLYSPLVVSISKILTQQNNLELTRAAYRALKHIHKTILDQRFFNLLKMAHTDSKDLYKNLYNFEETDCFLNSNETDSSYLILEYQFKRNYFNLRRDFGILNPKYLHQIRQAIDCERVRAVIILTRVLKNSPWTEKELDPYILDFLKIIKSFVCDTNSLVQINGLVILKEIICKMGFSLSPHITSITKILQPALASTNTKTSAKTEKVLFKLMCNIHPMTVLWNLLSTKDFYLKEAVLIFLQNVLNYFSYHEIDMVALCDYLGQDLENANDKIAKYCKDCVVVMFDKMNNCPAYGIRTEAVKILLQNHHLKTETLRDIGIIINTHQNEYGESIESYTDGETTIDTCSIPLGSTTTAFTETVSRNDISIAAESEITCTDIRSDLNICNTVNHNGSKYYIINEKEIEHFDKTNDKNSLIIQNRPSHSEFQTVTTWEEKYLVPSNKNNNNITESSDTSSIQEMLPSSGTDSVCSRYLSVFGLNKETENFQQQRTDSFSHGSSRNVNEFQEKQKLNENFNANSGSRTFLLEKHNSQKERYSNQQKRESFHPANYPIQSENSNAHQKFNTEYKPKKFSCFTMKTEVKSFVDNSKQLIGESTASLFQKSMKESEADTDSNVFESPTPHQNDVDTPQKSILNENAFNFGLSQTNDEKACADIETRNFTKNSECMTPESTNSLRKNEDNVFQINNQITKNERKKSELSEKTSLDRNDETASEFSFTVPRTDKYSGCQKEDEFNLHESKESNLELSNESVVDIKSCFAPPCRESIIQQNEDERSEANLCYELTNKCMEDSNLPLDSSSFVEMSEVLTEVSSSYPKDFEEIEKPFLPKRRQLARTPVKAKTESLLEVQPKLPKKSKNNILNKKKVEGKKTKMCPIVNNRREELEKIENFQEDKSLTTNDSDKKSSVVMNNTPLKWRGCQWRRDLEYAAKASPCAWANIFEKTIQSMKPFQTTGLSENEMKKVIDDLLGNSWKKKEDAMLTSIRLAKHHPKLIQDNASKVIVAVSNEIKNLRQSVAGKAILTMGYLYEIMGKTFEGKLRMVVAALLAKSGNRTLAAYFRLVIRSLFKIMDSTSPQKLASALIFEGSRHPNKAAKETAAQFLVLLTEQLGPENSIASFLASQMIKCAALFVFDSSPLTRYCGKRMFQVFINHGDFEKLKDHHLDIDTAQNLSNILEQIKTKGVTDEVLPINIIDLS